jgi:hypothetical protein
MAVTLRSAESFERTFLLTPPFNAAGVSRRKLHRLAPLKGFAAATATNSEKLRPLGLTALARAADGDAEAAGPMAIADAGRLK